MTRLDVTMLGGFALAVDGAPVPPIPSRLARSLVAYLLLHRDRPHRRDHLAGLFWPDMPASKARRRLSHTLWQVQDVLGELELEHDVVVATADTVAVDPDAPVGIDVEAFVAGVERFRPERRGARLTDLRALDRAVDRYQGELLAGHDDDWVQVERQRLSLLHLDALGWLVGLAKGEGAYEDALIYARRITLHDPVREDAHREVMRLCTLLGRTSEALRQYERCRSVLLEELDTAPSRETEQLAMFVERQREEAQPDPATEPLPKWRELRLVGRDRERAVLIDAMERTIAGRTTQVVIEGDVGVGKSRLVDQVVEDARWRDLVVLRGAATEGGRPYEAIVAAVTPELTPVRTAQLRGRLDDVWRREAGRLLPGLDDRASVAPMVGADARERLLEAVSQVLLAVLELTPSILVVEDLHHADDETLAVLDRLAVRLPGRAVGLVVTCRRTAARARPAVWQTLRRLDGMTVPDRVALGPLSAGETGQLVREVLPGVVPLRLTTRIHAETGGNPLFVVETLRAVLAEGVEDLDELATLPLPTSIHDLVAARFDALDEDAAEALVVSAHLGERFDLPLLAAASSAGSDSRVGAAVAGLLRDGPLVADGEHLAVSHDQVRRVVVDLAPDGDDVRRRVAAALLALRPERVDEAADHLDAVGDHIAAVRAHRDAARFAMEVHAFERARLRYARAVELQATVVYATTERTSLLSEYEEVLAVLGRRDEQSAVLRELLGLTAGTDAAADALCRRAWHAAQTDDLATATEAADQALRLAGDDRGRGLASTVLGTALLWRGDVTAATVTLERATTLLDGVDEGQARTTLGDARRRGDRPDLAVTEFERAIALARQADDVQLEVRALGNLAGTHLARHDHAAAEEALRATLELARAIGFRRAEAATLVNLAGLHQLRVEPGRALATLDEAVEVASAVDDVRLAAHARMNRADLLHHVVGRDEDAGGDAEHALRFFEELGDATLAAQCAETLASIELRRDAPDQAAGRLADLAEDLDGWTVAQLVPTHALVRLARGDVAGARTLVARPQARTTAVGLAVAARVAIAGDDAKQAGEWVDEARAAVEGGDDEHRLFVLVTAAQVAVATGAQPIELVETATTWLDQLLDDLAPDDRASAEAVPLHAELRALAADLLPTSVRIEVATRGAPIGRGAAATATRPVLVSVEGAVGPDQRRRVLLDVLGQVHEQGGDPTIADLASLLEVSAATIRRDLATLRDDGHDVRTRGTRAS